MYPKRTDMIRGRTWLFGAVAAAAISFAACAGDQSDKDAVDEPSAAQIEVADATEEMDPGICGENDPASSLELFRNAGDADLEPEPVLAAVSDAPEEVIEEAPAIAIAEATPVVQEPAAYVAPAAAPTGQLGVLTELDNFLSKARWVSNPTPWDRGRIGRYSVSDDREADRAKSLEERAALRSFEGAPPVMPHSESYSAGSKTCLDCHMEGTQIGKKVAHPMPHVTMANCTQCHVEQSSKLYDELLVPGNNFDGDRPVRKGVSSMEGAPPMIPHSTHMRTACLSCHGEFGYDGLRTDHPSRSNCMQCHIVEK